MRIAWLDVSAGVAGDMLLAALLDAGADLSSVQDAVEAVLPRTVALSTTEVLRAGTRAAHLDVRVLVEDQPHRDWAEIRDRLRTADLDPLTRDRALSAFEALADVEARIHGVPVEEVHFHEVGAWDSIADVVGVCAAVTDLGIDEVVASPVRLGSGLVRTAHGHLSVPVPAVLALSDGWQVTGDGDGELATPTGMCLLATLARSQGPLPAMTVTASGTGGGTRDTPGRPNIVRVVIGERTEVASKLTADGPDTDDETDDLTIEDLVVLEANVDDLDPRVWPGVIDALLAAGALDAWLTPILMKAGRPAHTLSVLARPADRDTLRDLLLDATSTLGVGRPSCAAAPWRGAGSTSRSTGSGSGSRWRIGAGGSSTRRPSSATSRQQPMRSASRSGPSWSEPSRRPSPSSLSGSDAAERHTTHGVSGAALSGPRSAPQGDRRRTRCRC